MKKSSKSDIQTACTYQASSFLSDKKPQRVNRFFILFADFFIIREFSLLHLKINLNYPKRLYATSCCHYIPFFIFLINSGCCTIDFVVFGDFESDFFGFLISFLMFLLPIYFFLLVKLFSQFPLNKFSIPNFYNKIT